MTENTISGVHVHVCPGSAETLVRRGGITNHRLIAYSLNIISAKKLPKSVDVRRSYSVHHQRRFLRHSVSYIDIFIAHVKEYILCFSAIRES